MSGDKADPVITAVARGAALAGYTTISVDLPGHGDRSDREALTPWAHCGELAGTAGEVSAAHRRVSLFACSLGAFMALHALARTPLDRALFASPLVDMEAFIARRMTLQGISERELRARRHVPLADGQSLDWDYLTWVRRHPVRWHHPTSVLYGRSDAIVPRPDIDSFTRATGAQLQVIPAGHYLHTPRDLTVLRHWVTGRLADAPARPTGPTTRVGDRGPGDGGAMAWAALPSTDVPREWRSARPGAQKVTSAAGTTAASRPGASWNDQ